MVSQVSFTLKTRSRWTLPGTEVTLGAAFAMPWISVNIRFGSQLPFQENIHQ